MNPEISHRVAEALSVENPDPGYRQRVARAAVKAGTFKQLPGWLQKFVQDAERKTLT